MHTNMSSGFIWVVLPIALFFNVKNTYAQELLFELSFLSGDGQTDTLTLGVDTTATRYIDPQFGEINLIDSGIDSGIFQVFFSDQFTILDSLGNVKDSSGRHYQMGELPHTFLSKTQIIDVNDGFFGFAHWNLSLVNVSWPVEVRMTLIRKSSKHILNFEDHEERATFVLATFGTPLHWWDAGSECGAYELHVLDTVNVRSIDSNLMCEMVAADSVVNHLAYVVLNQSLYQIGISELPQAKPNSFGAYCKLNVPASEVNQGSIQVVDMTGREVCHEFLGTQPPAIKLCDHVPEGLYLVKLLGGAAQIKTYYLLNNHLCD